MDNALTATINPKFTILGFKNSYGDLENNKIPMTVIWKVPSYSTMISKPENKNGKNWEDNYSGYYISSNQLKGTEDNWRAFFEL
jgi:hypothetical protein